MFLAVLSLAAWETRATWAKANSSSTTSRQPASLSVYSLRQTVAAYTAAQLREMQAPLSSYHPVILRTCLASNGAPEQGVWLGLTNC